MSRQLPVSFELIEYVRVNALDRVPHIGEFTLIRHNNLEGYSSETLRIDGEFEQYFWFRTKLDYVDVSLALKPVVASSFKNLMNNTEMTRNMEWLQIPTRSGCENILLHYKLKTKQEVLAFVRKLAVACKEF